jgi:hypothetical protein
MSCTQCASEILDKMVVRQYNLSIIHFILMVNINSSRCHHTNWIGFCKKSHQIKEVATLLNQSSSTVAVEPIPIVYLQELQQLKTVR